MNEKEIIEQIKQGNREAFKELVDEYKDMVFKVCFGFVKNKEDAEDITQDVFFSVYKNIKSFKSESKISTWLYRIAVNFSLNHIRKLKIQKMFVKLGIKEDNEEKVFNVPAGRDYNADFEIIQSEKMKIISKVLNELPSNQRIAFTLFNIEGFTYEKIAEIMNCSVPSVESRIHRAKMNLQKKLVKYFKEIK